MFIEKWIIIPLLSLGLCCITLNNSYYEKYISDILFVNEKNKKK